ncbi:MAG: cation:proton antiporter [Acidimicrobiia bacterium]|nr:cation:proton antiporter [Acidimicrobiia bacterium]
MVLSLVPASHEDILHVLVAFTVLLVAARLAGEMVARLGQPSVAGEILAGVLLGPSVLSALVPEIGAWIIPESAEAGRLLEMMGLIGAILLLLITGLETDIPLIRRHARTATWIAAGGLIVPFAAGLAVSVVVPDSALGDPGSRRVFALFLATALAVSAIPVVAKVLLDLGLIRKDFGQTVLAAGMIDDTVAWVLLSIVVALAGDEGGGLAGILGAAAPILVFLAVVATVGRRFLDGLLALVQDRGKSPDRVFTLVVASAFGVGAIAQAIGVEAVLGAFVAGIVFGQSPRLPAEMVRRLHTFTLAVFAPVFFAIAGLKVRIGDLLDGDLILMTFAVLGVAVAGKVGGAYLGARLAGQRHWIALAYGSALNARGAVGIIIASIGLDLGILSPELYSVVVVTAVVTSVVAPPMVRWCISKVEPDPEEERRLALEGGEGHGGGPRRVLIPIRPRTGIAPVHRVVADILRMGKSNPSVTLLAVARKEERAVAAWFVDEVAGLFPSRPSTRVVTGADPVRSILDAASADYDLLILGAPESPGTADVLFNPVVDDLARLAPCSTLIVTGRDLDEVAWPPRRILIPSDGSPAAERAARLGLRIAGDAEVIGLHVVEQYAHARTGAPEPSMDRRRRQASEIVEGFERLASAYGIRSKTEVRHAPIIADAIVAAAVDHRADLVVLGTDLRPGSVRLHLGNRVETVLRTAPCPVFILNTP